MKDYGAILPERLRNTKAWTPHGPGLVDDPLLCALFWTFHMQRFSVKDRHKVPLPRQCQRWSLRHPSALRKCLTEWSKRNLVSIFRVEYTQEKGGQWIEAPGFPIEVLASSTGKRIIATREESNVDYPDESDTIILVDTSVVMLNVELAFTGKVDDELRHGYVKRQFSENPSGRTMETNPFFNLK